MSITLPALPTAYFKQDAQFMPRYLRGRASLEIVRAMKAGRLTRQQVSAAMQAGEAGVAQLMIENALPQPMPRLAHDTFQNLKRLDIGIERYEEVRDMLAQLHREGDLTREEVNEAKAGTGFERWLFLMTHGLNRRISRLIDEIPEASGEDYTPFEVFPEALALTAFEQEDPYKGGSYKGEVRIQLVDTPFVRLPDDENEARLLFQAVKAVLWKIPVPYKMLLSMSETCELLGPFTFELVQDVKPHYRMYGANTAMYPGEVQEAIEEICGDEVSGDEWVQTQMSMWDEFNRIETTPGDVSTLSDVAKEKLAHLNALLTYVEAHPFPEERLMTWTSEDGDYPAIYTLTGLMEAEMANELGYYAADGLAYHKVASPEYDPTHPLKVFDQTVRAIAIQTALVRNLI